MTLPRFGRLLVLTLGCIAYLLVAGEALYRFTDGYRFDVAKLEPRPRTDAAPLDDHAAERALVEETRIDHKIDPDLFFSPPAMLDKPANPEIAERAKINTDMYGEENFIWNDAYLRNLPPETWLRKQKTDIVFAFRSYDGSTHPKFRLYPDTQSTLGTTNHFGWFSPDTTVDKPGDTIRIAIIGDSTAQNTIALYLQGFLNAWSTRSGARYRFEVLNAARQGLLQQDFIRILKYEVAPVTPDYVIFTEAPTILYQKGKLWTASPAIDTARPLPRRPFWLVREAHRLLKAPARWSALAERILKALDDTLPGEPEREPSKPAVELNPPLNMAGPPTLDDARTSPFFRSYLDDLDQLTATSADAHIIPIFTTDRACAYPGMAVSRALNPFLFGSINGPDY
ncbi:hypothetical protein SAMN05444161_3454 [Rhizobiales bacterium GAS191]|nr:hypothetical protein SAMN05519103_02622 [Rhizobiales bacterium GAS113]SED55186.1 hypothetical protein SAMN05444161_3454 [Rhizobiales bacterium GAS191]